ncbi:hypothetical protein ACHAWF_007252 [Thalassiosira exigua]
MYGENTEDVRVRAGSDIETGGVPIDIKKGYEHPKYDYDTDEYDLYIMILEDKVTDIDPVTVNSNPNWPPPRTQARSMGWGLTKEDGNGSPRLLEVDLGVISNDQCRNADEEYKDWIYEDMICTNTPGKDSCQGDSGGPLIVPDKKNPPVPKDDTLFGIVSWGVGCARMPGVYARTSADFDWIVEKVCVENNGNCPLCGASKVAPLAPGSAPAKPASPTQEITAVYDANINAPKCATVGSSCDSGDTLKGTGANVEPNAPNTLDECKDPKKGTYMKDESIDAIKVSAVGGSGRLEKRGMAEIEATVFSYKDGKKDEADFYYAKNANRPDWKYIGSAKPDGGGVQKLKVQYQIPQGNNLQAVRVSFRYEGRMINNGCSDGKFDERDDLAFAVDGAKEEDEETTSWQAIRGPQLNTDEKPYHTS